jgi:hypothetical protein
MADCCTPGSGFPTASQMEQLATNLPVVWEEICALQQAVLAASSQCQPGGGQMCTTVGGTTPMTFIAGVSSVTVVNGGAGYLTDTPSIRFIPPNGAVASGATATLITNGGNILGVTVTAGGSGYQPIPSNLSVSSLTGSGADIRPLVNANGEIVNVNIVSGGTGYTLGDSVVATRAVGPDAVYIDAVFKITSISITGQILGIVIMIPGTGYQPSVTTVEIMSTLTPLLHYPTGTGFYADVLTDNTGAITSVVVVNTGAGYATVSPYLVISNPGTGATTAVTLTGDSVSSIAVLINGSQYTPGATGTVFNPSTAVLPNPPVTPAVVTVNVSSNTYGTNPNLYYQVWQGTETNKPIMLQMNSVITYFTKLGYTISRITNPATSTTFQWKICW